MSTMSNRMSAMSASHGSSVPQMKYDEKSKTLGMGVGPNHPAAKNAQPIMISPGQLNPIYLQNFGTQGVGNAFSLPYIRNQADSATVDNVISEAYQQGQLPAFSQLIQNQLYEMGYAQSPDADEKRRKRATIGAPQSTNGYDSNPISFKSGDLQKTSINEVNNAAEVLGPVRRQFRRGNRAERASVAGGINATYARPISGDYPIWEDGYTGQSTRDGGYITQSYDPASNVIEQRFATPPVPIRVTNPNMPPQTRLNNYY